MLLKNFWLSRTVGSFIVSLNFSFKLGFKLSSNKKNNFKIEVSLGIKTITHLRLSLK